MKRIILCISLFIFIRTEAQQINPVPDYVFSNKISVGRNAVTDTAAYFSIGPRYGAIRGMMPPMVTDTASMSATKRNGLLIFSIQKNKYLYWDSVGSKWAEMAGTAGSAITGSGVAGYMPEFTTATNLDTTKLYHSAGRFAIGSTTTTNGVFNVYSGQSYMDSSLKIGNGELIVGSTSSASRKLYVTSNSDVARFAQTGSDKNMVIELLHTNPNASGTIREEGINFLAPNTTTRGRITFYPSDTFNVRNYLAFFTPSGSGTNAERMRIINDGNVGIGTTSPTQKLTVSGNVNAVQSASTNTYFEASSGTASIAVGTDGTTAFIYPSGANLPVVISQNGSEAIRINTGKELLVNTTSDAGGYSLQVAGSIYNTTGAVFAASSGNVGIGVTSPAYKLSVRQATQGTLAEFRTIDGDNPGLNIETNANGTMLMQVYSGGNTKTLQFGTNSTERMRLKEDGELLIGTTSDAGAYALQVAGSIYNTTGAAFAVSSGEILIGGVGDVGDFKLQVNGNSYVSGNMGIGNSSPTQKLDVQGAARVRSYIHTPYWYADYSISTTNATPANFATALNGTHYFGTYSNTQQSGLGTAGWVFGLHDTNNDYGYSYQFISDFSANIALRAANSSTTWKTPYMLWKSDGEVLIGGTSDAGAYALQVAGSIYNTTGAVLAASSGNVGISTTSPAVKLHIYSPSESETMRLQFNGAGPYMSFYNATTRNGYIQFSSSDGTVLVNETNTLMAFHTNNTERMRIKSDGEVLIGSTSDAGTYALQVTGAMYNTTTITTGAPTSGSAKPWRLGEAATVSPTSPNRTIRVEIDGTVYYIHAKTTND